MEEVIDLIATDASPSDISDKIKSLLFSKAAERIEVAKPVVAASMFGKTEETEEEEE
jgi:hypothetical protein